MGRDTKPRLRALAGLTLVFQRGGRRRTLALYMAARLAQCCYNSLKARGRWHFWGSDWAYGDALLFALSSAQVRGISFLTRLASIKDVCCCCAVQPHGP